MKEIKVALKNNSYKIIIGHSILSFLGDFLSVENKNVLAVIDENVFNNFNDELNTSLSKLSQQLKIYLLKPGEKSKSFSELTKIHSYLLANNFGRDSLIIAIGGGVTGDLVGFAASTFMRGIELVHVPTTLLADVDSSIGGKTGINFNHKKNMIGTFYQPKLVLLDTEFIKTLPKNEITSGIGEIIKYAYMSDKIFFNYLLENIDKIYKKNYEVLNEVIKISASIKAAVVAQDEKESGLRKILNLGHTFAHAYESELNFKVKHGEAVIAGIISSLFLSFKLKLITKIELTKFLELTFKIRLSNRFNSLNKENIFQIMKSDKKNRSGKIKFVLLSDIGKLLIDVEAEKNDIFYAIDEMQKTLMVK